MQRLNKKKYKITKIGLNKIAWTLFRWISLIFWIICIWAGIFFAIQLLCTVVVLLLEVPIIYSNIKENKSIWG